MFPCLTRDMHLIMSLHGSHCIAMMYRAKDGGVPNGWAEVCIGGGDGVWVLWSGGWGYVGWS